MSDTELGRAELSDSEVDRRLVAALKARGGTASEADAVVDSGVPPHVAGPGLRRLMLAYPCRLDVTEGGDIVYRFAPSFPRRDTERYAAARALGRAAWRAFVVVYKVAIAVVLVGYFLLFLALLVAALVAAMSANRGRSERSSSRWGSRGGGMPGGWFWLWAVGDRDRRRHQGLRGTRWSGARHDAADPRPFYKKVFSFVFGLEKDPADALCTEKELLAWIRSHGGVVAPTELASLTGWSVDAAESESTRLLARYGGDIEVTNDGTILYRFADLLATAGGSAAARPAPRFWERWEAPASVTGNRGAANAGIAFLNAFILANAVVVTPAFLAPMLALPLREPLVFAGLVVFPAVYSVLFFLVPAARWLFSVRPANARRAARNLRRALLRQAHSSASGGQARPLVAPEAAAAALQSVPEGVQVSSRSPATAEQRLVELAFEYDAATDADDEGRALLTFERIADEAVAAAAARRGEGARLIQLGRQPLAFSTAE